MKLFAIFPALIGSDQLLPLDGRWGQERIRRAVVEQARRLQRLHRTTKLRRAEIYRGSRISDARKCYELLFGEEDLCVST